MRNRGSQSGTGTSRHLSNNNVLRPNPTEWRSNKRQTPEQVKIRRRRRVHIAELEPLNVPALDGTFTSHSGLVDPRPWPCRADVCQNTTELQKSDGALGPNVQQQLFLAEVAVNFHRGSRFRDCYCDVRFIFESSCSLFILFFLMLLVVSVTICSTATELLCCVLRFCPLLVLLFIFVIAFFFIFLVVIFVFY